MMVIDRQKLYGTAADFFDLDGNAQMKLSRDAAAKVCVDAAVKGFLVVKVEGGIWNNGRFEARTDAIWDGIDPPVVQMEAHQNNLRAAAFITSLDDRYNAFILTEAHVGGYAISSR